MTWREFIEAVEAQDVVDDDEIIYIDLMGEDRPRVVRPKGNRVAILGE